MINQQRGRRGISSRTHQQHASLIIIHQRHAGTEGWAQACRGAYHSRGTSSGAEDLSSRSPTTHSVVSTRRAEQLSMTGGAKTRPASDERPTSVLKRPALAASSA